ncbi:ribonuclease catalytic domain-containing protein [Acanthopleuribacter pedis]|uniref:RNB domain-containing ribonuclease n=1 Tax=Acanthopleuribacter pedis TaxID=442870 RepID=A0A8J7QL87_9BACT|nr:RNB domain-containing ribonuclease [Acanthopleuribacter pedis]MBO1320303.1 RNB domain-containing ribonuclease [Acanthopleuribacter pedis]
MPTPPLAPHALVLYKNGPARVLSVGEKVEIKTENGKAQKVRPKDIVCLHPGPLHSFAQLEPQEANLEEAWGLLLGESTDLAELTELIFSEYTPVTAWSTWQIVEDGLYFVGTPGVIEARSEEKVTRDKAERAAKKEAEEAWSAFISRVRENRILPEDHTQLKSVELVALSKNPRSKILQQLGLQETKEAAHHLLLKLGLWDETKNPYPVRFSLPTEAPELVLPELPEEDRLDLTHLPAFAIDDEGNKDPDDAISIDGNRLWIHVADVAAIIKPDSDIDLEARSRGANLYLPEKTIPMLPTTATDLLGLGLTETSPALSFGVVLNQHGEIEDIEIKPSWVKVTRLSYEQANGRMDEAPFAEMAAITERYRARRFERGAANISLPEVKINVVDGEIRIKPVASLKSRDMVTDAMLIAGEAAARFAIEHQIPFAFAGQAPPDANETPEDMAAMFGYRKKFKRTQIKGVAEPHSGLGLDSYARATSPLRRYLDLVVHQQLRAFLRGEPILNDQQMTERVGASEAVTGHLRQVERLSNRHWLLLYLKRREAWRGLGVLVDQRDKRYTVLIPELALDSGITLQGDWPMNTEIPLSVAHINLADQSIGLRMENS